VGGGSDQAVGVLRSTQSQTGAGYKAIREREVTGMVEVTNTTEIEEALDRSVGTSLVVAHQEDTASRTREGHVTSVQGPADVAGDIEGTSRGRRAIHLEATVVHENGARSGHEGLDFSAEGRRTRDVNGGTLGHGRVAKGKGSESRQGFDEEFHE